jgi:mRNA interferase YafQ
MRQINRLKRFKKDFRRELAGQHRKILNEIFPLVISLLVNDHPLPANFHDHALTGDWADHRDCHIRPDLVMIYRKPDDDTLELVRLGSHSELDL